MEQHEHVEQKHEHVDPNYELGTEQQHKDDGQQRHVQLEQANILND